MIRVGIYGATGYMGGELLRVLLLHPEVNIEWACSRQPQDIAHFHPNLYESGIQLVDEQAITDEVDLVFLALPTELSIEKADYYLSKGIKVIDLGAAFRLKNQQHWEQAYRMRHSHWHLVNNAVYGVSELHFEEIQQADIIANPGCFASAVILALAPLINRYDINSASISVTGISGSAGVGAELSRAAHHPELGNNLIAYNVVNHRHSYEMEQELSALFNQSNTNDLTVHFTPVYAPITRGILAINHVPLLSHDSIDRAELLSHFKSYYSDHPFVKIFDLAYEDNASWQYRPYPWVSAVTGSNYCHIGLDVDQTRRSVVILSVLDSIGKGGAQVAVENMNIMFGLPRESGLKAPGRHPC